MYVDRFMTKCQLNLIKFNTFAKIFSMAWSLSEQAHMVTICFLLYDNISLLDSYAEGLQLFCNNRKAGLLKSTV